MSLSAEYDRWHGERAGQGDADSDSPWHRLVREYLGSLAGKRVLEIACGRGGFTTVLASLGGRVIGSDFSRTALEIARHKIGPVNGTPPAISLAQSDAAKLPFLPDSFDIIISCETIEHLPDPQAALSEMARVCRSNGFLYLTTPNYFNLMGLYRVYDRLRSRPQASDEAQPYDTVWTFPRVRRLIRDGGWKILRTDGTVHQIPFPGRSPITVHPLESSAALRRALGVFALHQFVLAQKVEAHR